jgi:hypothetical protein
VVLGPQPAPGEPPIDETISELAEREFTVLKAPQLTFERIQLDSRLEITLAAAGTTGVIIYAPISCAPSCPSSAFCVDAAQVVSA